MDKESQSASSAAAESQAGLLGVSGNHLGRAWMPAGQWLGMVVGTQEETTEAVDPSKQERGLQGISECQSARERFMMMMKRNLLIGGVRSPWTSPLTHRQYCMLHPHG